jgi:hypothetical protein
MDRLSEFELQARTQGSPIYKPSNSVKRYASSGQQRTAPYRAQFAVGKLLGRSLARLFQRRI